MPHRSLWLTEALGDAPDEPSLDGALRADVCIVGGGYTGLWTAIRIKEIDPACDVVLLEQDVCGGGPSGRNGGFAVTWWSKLPTYVKLFGEAEALRLCRASSEAVRELGAFAQREGFDCHYREGGFLWTATCEPHVGCWEDAVGTAERLGADDVWRRLPPDEVAARAGSPAHLAGVFEPVSATVQPALLARGLRAAALRAGVRIFEHTRMTALDRGSPPVVRTERGVVAADKVVLATNAWAANMRELHRRLVVVSSDMVATEPIPERLAEIGWTGGEAVSDSYQMVCYYRTTRDGRIAFGKGGWTLALAGRIGEGFDRHAGQASVVTAALRRYYPQLADVEITHDWAGPIDRPAAGPPLIGRLGGRDHILYGVGWSGNGVAPCVLGGRMLASLALGRRDEWSQSPLVDGVPGSFPPEPVRFLGGHLVRGAVARKEAAQAAGRAPSRLDLTLAGLAPAAFVPKAKKP